MTAKPVFAGETMPRRFNAPATPLGRRRRCPASVRARSKGRPVLGCANSQGCLVHHIVGMTGAQQIKKVSRVLDERVANQVNQSLPICVQKPSWLVACTRVVNRYPGRVSNRRAKSRASSRKPLLLDQQPLDSRLEIDTPTEAKRPDAARVADDTHQDETA